MVCAKGPGLPRIRGPGPISDDYQMSNRGKRFVSMFTPIANMPGLRDRGTIEKITCAAERLLVTQCRNSALGTAAYCYEADRLQQEQWRNPTSLPMCRSERRA